MIYDRYYFDNLKETGRLQSAFPEIYALIGVEQPVKWHPEGDAYEHTMLVVQQALIQYAEDNLVYLGALCHDLGKALTPKEKWPKHYGHAKAGIKLVRPAIENPIFGGKFNHLINQVEIITEYHMHIHQAEQMKNSTYQKIYLDIFNRCGKDPEKTTETINALVRVGVCDHYGRKIDGYASFYPNPYIFYQRINNIYEETEYL